MKKQTNPDRLPPSSPAAERAVLGCILLEPTDCLVECAERWGDVAVFYTPQHQVVYDATQRMQTQGKIIDIVTVCEELKAQGKLDQVGGVPAIAQLYTDAPPPGNLADYADIVWGHYQRRAAIRVATEIAIAAYESEAETNTLLTQFEEKVFRLPRANERGARAIGLQCKGVKDRIEHYRRGIGTLTGIATGFRYWDKMAAGLQNNEMIVIGGRPGTGKTSLAMNVAENVAMGGFPRPVGVMSLEMSSLDLTLRLSCARARVNFHKLRTGHATNDDLHALPEIIDQVEKAPIYIDDESSLSLFEVRSRLRAMKQRYAIQLAIIDYLQLITLPPQYFGDPVRGYGEVAKGIMASAKELGIPIIVLSQLSREGEKRGGRPRMSDLRESGDIEACAHFIGILYPEKVSEDQEKERRKTLQEDAMAELTIPMLMEVCKNRNGPSGTAMQLEFMRWCMRYEDRYEKSKDPTKAAPDRAPAEPKSDHVIDPETIEELARWADRQGKGKAGNGGPKQD